MTELPDGWEVRPLSEICEILDSRRIPINTKERNDRIEGKNHSELFPYYGATGQVGVIDAFLFEGEHVLIGEDGAPFLDPKKHKAYLVSGRFWVNNHAHILKSFFSDRFLCHYLNSIPYSEHVTGTTRLKLTKGALEKIPVLLPPLQEQHRIVSKIEALFSELDAGQDSLTRAQAQLKLYRQSLLKAAFQGRLTADWRNANADKLEPPETLLSSIRTEREARYKQALDDWQTALAEWRAGGEVGRKPAKPKRPADVLAIDPDEIAGLPPLPSGWVYCRFGEFIKGITAGNSFACDEREPSPDEIGVAKVSAVSWGEYNEAESKTCRDPERVDPSLFVKEGDFLLSRANTIELVGASVIVRRVTKRVMLSDKTLRLTFDAGNQRYFLAYLRSLTGRSEIEKRSTGNQESMRNIGQDRIRSIIVPICSSAETEEVVSVLDNQLSGLAAIETEITTALTKLSALRQSILKKAFSGQLVPQDPSDEPASALLARLRDTTPTPRRKTKA
jgi:type I restriction enzyme, S subunit